MEMKMEKFFITTAIDYVNAAPHLGHALEKVQADVIARYQRLLGKDIFFLTGTDEHGAKVAKAAETQGKNVGEFVNEISETFKNLAKELNISNDDFIRTSDKTRHWPTARALWVKLAEKGDIYKANYKGFYCLGCEAFITKKDLIDGKCVIHNQKPEEINEENYFFKLSAYQNKIKKAITSGKLKIIPEGGRNEILSFLESGLEDTSFSRPAKDISWGIPVPLDNSQTMYVWADALSNYISALGYGTENTEKFQKYWPADIHVIGKDILRFHALIWPGMLIAAGLDLPKTIFAHGMILAADRRKMSKSLGNIIDPFDIIYRYSTYALRYYLTREIPVTEDGDLTEEKFKEAYNANLANGLGNSTARVLKMAEQYFGGIIVKPTETAIAEVPFQKNEKEFFSVPYVIENLIWPQYRKAMDNLELNKAMDIIWSIITQLDGYIQNYQPFKLINTDKGKTGVILWNLVFGLANISWMLLPFLPETSEKIFKALGIDAKSKENWSEFHVKPIEPLFLRKE